MKLYERCANEIAELIRTGMLRPGDRLPSVRATSAARGLSRSTVFEAYYLLETRGLIEARPRSGYYVKTGLAHTKLEAPADSKSDGRARNVDIGQLVFELLGPMARREFVPLGSAFLSPSLCPLPRLARHLWTEMRDLEPWRLIEDLAPGSEALRRHIKLRYAMEGIAVDSAELVLTNGGLEGMNLSLQAVTRPGDLVVVESPTFYAALQALERLQLRSLEVATSPARGIDIDALAAALEHQRVSACWLMTSFQNPLGSSMPEDRKKALVALLAKHAVPLIEDDVYAELYFGAKKPLPAKAFDAQGLVMNCGSFSKCLAPGYRVGWVAGGRFAAKIEQMRLMYTLSPAIPSEAAIAAYLDQGGYDRHLRRMRKALAGYLAVAIEAVQTHFPAGTRMAVPEGGYFLWLELPTAVDTIELHMLAREHGISLSPGPLFSAARRFRNCVRLNYGHGGDPRFVPALKTVGELATQCAASRHALADGRH
ncbi:aminotransferase-like domain-containing protein [Variovorax sp. RA8]|uniref:aminotransferase-like domain-containing protein n=1 Tax=Variovorax sp. (strain JCM 16519 / RA8) TaxID=662548 RepID=UPI0013181D05|nr:PLP-dependent aminotransferase family protein [Variovorax sp. RA8]VTU16445.1 putative HTH-type transcriptional regulator YdcR [Variovorax sp. RA8]